MLLLYKQYGCRIERVAKQLPSFNTINSILYSGEFSTRTHTLAVSSQSQLLSLHRTCDMLRLHGACFHQEGLSALKRQHGLTHQPALRRVGSVVQLDDLLEIGRPSIG